MSHNVNYLKKIKTKHFSVFFNKPFEEKNALFLYKILPFVKILKRPLLIKKDQSVAQAAL
jgi:hypothetical protein